MELSTPLNITNHIKFNLNNQSIDKLKYAFDRLLAIFGLIIASPIMLIISILIVIDVIMVFYVSFYSTDSTLKTVFYAFDLILCIILWLEFLYGLYYADDKKKDTDRNVARASLTKSGDDHYHYIDDTDNGANSSRNVEQNGPRCKPGRDSQKSATDNY